MTNVPPMQSSRRVGAERRRLRRRSRRAIGLGPEACPLRGSGARCRRGSCLRLERGFSSAEPRSFVCRGGEPMERARTVVPTPRNGRARSSTPLSTIGTARESSSMPRESSRCRPDESPDLEAKGAETKQSGSVTLFRETNLVSDLECTTLRRVVSRVLVQG
jgi:hypothetical protein